MTSRTTDGQEPARAPLAAASPTVPPALPPAGAEADPALGRVLAAVAALDGATDPTTVLERLVRAARDLVDADSAVAVLDDHAGRPSATVWSVTDDSGTVGRTGTSIADELADHVRRRAASVPLAGGSPSPSPSPTSARSADRLPVLSVPLQAQGVGLGVLALAGPRGRDGFTASEEQAVALLAGAAAPSLRTSTLLAESADAAAWGDADDTLDRLVGDATAGPGPLLETAAAALAVLLHADLVVVLGPDGSEHELLEVRAAAGPAAGALADARLPVAGSAAHRVLEERSPLRLAQPDGLDGLDAALRELVPYDSVLVVPLPAAGTVPAVVLSARLDPAGFSATELTRTQRFADRLGITLEALEARHRAPRLRDLHDHVIQHLFATGLSLESVVAGLPPGELQVRADAAVEDLDQTIERVQTTMSTLGET